MKMLDFIIATHYLVTNIYNNAMQPHLTNEYIYNIKKKSDI